jgi:hypothetical protein
MTRQITLTVVVNEQLLETAISAGQEQSFPTDLAWLMAGVTDAIVQAVTAEEDETPRGIFHDGEFVGYVVADRLLRETGAEQEPGNEPGESDLPEWVDLQADVVRTTEGVTFTPMSVRGAIGYTVRDTAGRVEHVFLLPTTDHDINLDDRATADVFLYHADTHASQEWAVEAAKPGSTAHLADFAEPEVYVKHFYGTADNEETPGT